MSVQDSFKLEYRILHGHCVPASDVIKMIGLINKANELSDTVVWNKGDGQPSLSISKEQFIKHLLATFETSLKAYERDEVLAQRKKDGKNSGGILEAPSHL